MRKRGISVAGLLWKARAAVGEGNRRSKSVTQSSIQAAFSIGKVG